MTASAVLQSGLSDPRHLAPGPANFNNKFISLIVFVCGHFVNRKKIDTQKVWFGVNFWVGKSLLNIELIITQING